MSDEPHDFLPVIVILFILTGILLWCLTPQSKLSGYCNRYSTVPADKIPAQCEEYFK